MVKTKGLRMRSLLKNSFVVAFLGICLIVGVVGVNIASGADQEVLLDWPQLDDFYPELVNPSGDWSVVEKGPCETSSTRTCTRGTKGACQYKCRTKTCCVWVKVNGLTQKVCTSSHTDCITVISPQ